jgi:hypothetical protein
VTALIRARERLFGLGHSIVADQEHGNLERRVGVAPLIGANVRGRGTIDVASLLQQHTKLGRRDGVTALIRPRERVFGIAQPVLGEQEHPQGEPGVRQVALVGAAVCGFSATHVAARLAQHAEVEGRGGVTMLVGTRKPLFGLG